jgi:3-hydroxymyristoyl/3-hydroxydecanoyl-(acyl carrier protein) dehydratase
VTERFEIESTTGAGDERVVKLRVPTQGSRFFEGHFDGMPMLPGVAQIVAIAHREAERTFGVLGSPRRMSRVKFQDTILPGDALSLTLHREVGAETRVRFEIARLLPEGARVASSGTITYGSEA